MTSLLIALLCAQTRTFFTLPASNGHGAIVADTQAGKLVHFREHLPASEEPQLDVAGNPVVLGNQPQVITTRNLLFDAYFGIRSQGQQRWLQGLPVVSSGYENGIVTWQQSFNGVTLTTYAFAPRALPHAGFVMLLRVQGAATAFSLHNFHLGFGRPTPGTNGETVVVTNGDLIERAFAGVVVTRALGAVQHAFAWNPTSAQKGFDIVQSTTGDFPDSSGDLGVADDWASGFEFGAGEWAGFVVAHHGDPFAAATVTQWLDAYVGAKTPQQLLDDERAAWAGFQAQLTLPPNLTTNEQRVARQSAVMLEMARVQESQPYLREWLSRDGEPRNASKFTATLPGLATTKGQGAVLASLPPGEWTYAWVRDSTYAAAAMASVGMTSQATQALRFMLDAAPALSLTRYTGFGVPEQDWNDYGPNVEYDGHGLTLWALRKVGLTDARLADQLVALIDPATGLMKKDSSIWETHTLGRERSWTYTNVTAVRGLCDAAAMEPGNTTWKPTALALRRAIATKLTDRNGALASNLEELTAGQGYADAAVLDAFALGLFKPGGRIETATRALLDAQLKTPHGWARNDDRVDTNGLSPWGSEYDSAEWVFTALRGGQRDWTTANAAANAGVIPETYDEVTSAWKFNAPMIGFGAGVYLLSFTTESPACGIYFEDEAQDDAGTMPPPPLPKGCGCDTSAGPLALALLARLKRVRAARKMSS